MLVPQLPALLRGFLGDPWASLLSEGDNALDFHLVILVLCTKGPRPLHKWQPPIPNCPVLLVDARVPRSWLIPALRWGASLRRLTALVVWALSKTLVLWLVKTVLTSVIARTGTLSPCYYFNFCHLGRGPKLASPVPRVALVLHYR